MEKFTKVTGVAVPLMRQNVDTDLVIRIERLVSNTSRQWRANVADPTKSWSMMGGNAQASSKAR